MGLIFFLVYYFLWFLWSFPFSQWVDLPLKNLYNLLPEKSVISAALLILQSRSLNWLFIIVSPVYLRAALMVHILELFPFDFYGYSSVDSILEYCSEYTPAFRRPSFHIRNIRSLNVVHCWICAYRLGEEPHNCRTRISWSYEVEGMARYLRSSTGLEEH